MQNMEERLADMATQALELVKTMEAVRMAANEATQAGKPIAPVDRLLLHLIIEEEAAMRSIARNLATWQHLTCHQPESVE